MYVHVQGISNLIKVVAEYAFSDGISAKVFDFWFHFKGKIRFPLFVDVIYRDHKAYRTLL